MICCGFVVQFVVRRAKDHSIWSLGHSAINTTENILFCRECEFLQQNTNSVQVCNATFRSVIQSRWRPSPLQLLCSCYCIFTARVRAPRVEFVLKAVLLMPGLHPTQRTQPGATNLLRIRILLQKFARRAYDKIKCLLWYLLHYVRVPLLRFVADSYNKLYNTLSLFVVDLLHSMLHDKSTTNRNKCRSDFRAGLAAHNAFEIRTLFAGLKKTAGRLFFYHEEK